MKNCTKSKYMKEALKNDPDGTICAYCGNKNDFVDDIGWFYISAMGQIDKPCCNSCWWDKPGEEHRKKYGCGER